MRWPYENTKKCCRCWKEGLIDRSDRQLMSGKEADRLLVVRSGRLHRCAKRSIKGREAAQLRQAASYRRKAATVKKQPGKRAQWRKGTALRPPEGRGRKSVARTPRVLTNCSVSPMPGVECLPQPYSARMAVLL